MEVQCEEVIYYEVISPDGKDTKKFYNIEDVIEFIRAVKYSEVIKSTRVIIK